MAGGEPQLLARWADFTGGHWGAVGAQGAKEGSWGGKNVLLTRDGALGVVSASRELVFDNLFDGFIRGMHWAWGIDGKVYFEQDELDGDCVVRRFAPNFVGGPITVESVGVLNVPATRPPAWADFSGQVIVSNYGGRTYRINPLAAGLNTLSTVSGTAPGGKAAVAYGESLMIGGIADARLGTQGNRVCFSTKGNVEDFPDENFFDVGVDNKEIAGMYVMLDVLYIVFVDQEIWTFRGTPGSEASSLRRAYGYHAGSGGVSTFVHDNAVVDPQQNTLWVFDHTSRGLARFNGGQMVRIPGYGIVTGERTTELNPDGQIVSIGGPGELMVDRVPVPQVHGEGAAGESNELVRVNGAFGLVEQNVLRGKLTPPEPPPPDPPPETPEPVVTSVVPDHGPEAGGTAVVIHGFFLSDPTAVSFGGTPATSFLAVDDFTVNAVAPAGVGTVHVTVTTDAGTSATSGADAYTYDSPGGGLTCIATTVETFTGGGPGVGLPGADLEWTASQEGAFLSLGVLEDVHIVAGAAALKKGPTAAPGTVSANIAPTLDVGDSQMEVSMTVTALHTNLISPTVSFLEVIGLYACAADPVGAPLDGQAWYATVTANAETGDPLLDGKWLVTVSAIDTAFDSATTPVTNVEISPLAPGDILKLRVEGVGAAATVTFTVNGITVGAPIDTATDLTYTGGMTPADLPVGHYCGLQLTIFSAEPPDWETNWTDVLRVDNFTACKLG